MPIYLDHAASTPMRPEARAALQAVQEDAQLQANPSSAHSLGRNARERLEECRQTVARHFACGPGDVVFNSGGSEGDTQALLGAAWSMPGPCHIAISAIE